MDAVDATGRPAANADRGDPASTGYAPLRYSGCVGSRAHPCVSRPATPFAYNSGGFGPGPAGAGRSPGNQFRLRGEYRPRCAHGGTFTWQLPAVDPRKSAAFAIRRAKCESLYG